MKAVMTSVLLASCLGLFACSTSQPVQTDIGVAGYKVVDPNDPAVSKIVAVAGKSVGGKIVKVGKVERETSDGHYRLDAESSDGNAYILLVDEKPDGTMVIRETKRKVKVQKKM